MSILVIASTVFEIEPFLEKYPNADILITGVGIPTSMYSLMECICQNKYNFLLQVGVAGTYSNQLKLGEVVVVEKDCFGDIVAIEKNEMISLFDLGLAEKNGFPYADGWLINKDEFNASCKKVKAVTVNLLTDIKEHIELIQKKYQADIETMEGAVLHYVALQKNIPFLQIRGISNEVGERDKSKWKMKAAIESSNNLLIKVYENYSLQNHQQ